MIDDGGTVASSISPDERRRSPGRSVPSRAWPGRPTAARSGSPRRTRSAARALRGEPLRKAAQHRRRAGQPHSSRHLENRDACSSRTISSEPRCTSSARATAEERDLSWLNWTLGTDLSDDGKTVLSRKRAAGPYVVGLRPTDGSPIVRLSPGSARGLSYDGKWALVVPDSGKDDVVAADRSRPGRSRSPARRSGRMLSISWFPDGKQILYSGVEPGHRTQTLRAGASRPARRVRSRRKASSRPAMTRAISPDGRSFLARPHRRRLDVDLLRSQGGEPRRVEAIDPGARAPRALDRGRSWHLHSGTGGSAVPDLPPRPARPERASRGSASRPRTPPGAEDTSARASLRRRRDCAYTLLRKLSTLYVVDGLR